MKLRALILEACYTLLEAVRHFRSVVIDAGSRGTTAHAHQCCIFQGYPKAVPSRMKLTMREPASMTTDKGAWRMTSYSNSVLITIITSLLNICSQPIKSKDFRSLYQVLFHKVLMNSFFKQGPESLQSYRLKLLEYPFPIFSL